MRAPKLVQDVSKLHEFDQRIKTRTIKDRITQAVTIAAASFGVIILILIIGFILVNGVSSLSWDLITGNYAKETYTVTLAETVPESNNFTDPRKDGVFFSKRWGIGLKDGLNTEKEATVFITYIADSSPLMRVTDVADESHVNISKGFEVSNILFKKDGSYLSAFSKDGAEQVALTFDQADQLHSMITTSGGGGIRGSILSTLYLILLVLVLAIPLGVGAAVYLHEYAGNNWLTNTMRTMIDMISGIPSIIFGLLGAVIFIPLMNAIINSKGGSLASGALTLTIIVLPTVIKTTEEALKAIPDSYRQASLALGASKVQTIFKVVLPNATGGILTATLLAIGRIIGESAALIFAIGTSIQDKISISGQSTSLAVHIWRLMGGEVPNLRVSCAISIIIMIIVLLLSIGVKLINKRMRRFQTR